MFVIFLEFEVIKVVLKVLLLGLRFVAGVGGFRG